MGSPIRILHAVVNMNRGGAETLLMNLYRHLDKKKVQFDFLTCKEGVFDSEILAMGGRIYRTPYVSEVGHFKYIDSLRNFFAAHNEFDIIHAHMDKMSGIVLREAKQAGVRYCIAHSHNTRSEGNPLIKLYKWIVGWRIKGLASARFSCSTEAAKWLFGRSGKDSLMLRNGINIHEYVFSEQVRKRMLRQLGIEYDQFVVGHIGRFNRQKNHSLLIDIFSEVLKLKPNAVLILVGDGILKDQIYRKVSEIGIDGHVKFLGVRRDVPQLLQAFDALIFPSLHEGLPLTLIEAQGASVPCVISETVTREVDMGAGVITFVSLKEQASVWAHQVIKAARKDRKMDTSHYIKDKGYDIRETASWLQDYYLDVTNSISKEEKNSPLLREGE